ncbi:BnaCnng41330D [Brassica napus]|uniref:BnaCnng41330D protein n=1 Tax=Brassica napus TaxID=3708 RepID=A0A078JDM1_BRANA|nr:BnaCnng41330D [Brassica napus]
MELMWFGDGDQCKSCLNSGALELASYVFNVAELSVALSIHMTHIRIKTHTSGGFKNQRLHRWRTAQRWCTEKEGVARPSIEQVLRLLSESCDPLHLELATAVEEDKGWSPRGDLASSSRSHCSRSFLVETGSPPNGLSFRFTSRILALRVIKLFSNCNFGR